MLSSCTSGYPWQGGSCLYHKHCNIYSLERKNAFIVPLVAVLQDTAWFVQELGGMNMSDMVAEKVYKHHIKCVD